MSRFWVTFLCVLFYTDPLAARTFRKDGVAQIDKAWGASPGAAAAPETPVPSKRSRSRSDKHKHHKHKQHHHHHHEKESTKGAQQQQQQQPARKSLLEEHLERVQSGAAPAKRARGDAQQSLTWRMPGSSSSTGGTAYWDRERDMEAMHVSRQTVTDLLGRADALGSRFRSGGSSTRFV